MNFNYPARVLWNRSVNLYIAFIFSLCIYQIFIKNAELLCSTAAFNMDNNKTCLWAADQHIRMISEGSCDSEDWSNDAGNSALLHRNKLYLKIS